MNLDTMRHQNETLLRKKIMNKTEKKTIEPAVKHGFTFKNDSFFTTFNQGNRTINKLVKQGYLEVKTNEYGTEYTPTDAARDFIKYGLTIEEVNAA